NSLAPGSVRTHRARSDGLRHAGRRIRYRRNSRYGPPRRIRPSRPARRYRRFVRANSPHDRKSGRTSMHGRRRAKNRRTGIHLRNPGPPLQIALRGTRTGASRRRPLIPAQRMKPLVTVVIPTCNRSAYLRETLQSVREQDYENLEILVSDNASTDDTAAVVSEIAASDPRVRYRRNLVKIPLIPHFNQCVAQARGEFFVLLSDDDRVNETFV